MVLRRSRRRSWGSTLRRFAPADGCRGVSRMPSLGARPMRGSLALVRQLAASARPGPHVLSRSSAPDGIGRGRYRVVRSSRTPLTDRECPAGLLGFAPVCGPCPPAFFSAVGPILPWVFVASVRVLHCGVDRSDVAGAFTVRGGPSNQSRCARASPTFFERTRHSPGTSAAQSVTRAVLWRHRLNVMEISGPAASNTDDLHSVTDSLQPTARGTH